MNSAFWDAQARRKAQASAVDGIRWLVTMLHPRICRHCLDAVPMALMHNPPHPGEVIREYLGDIPVTVAAGKLGVARSTLARVLACRSGVSPDMSYRLAGVFGTSPEFWAAMQMQYDLFQAGKKKRPTLRQMLSKFDPKKHGGEIMSDSPVGVEVLAKNRVFRKR